MPPKASSKHRKPVSDSDSSASAPQRQAAPNKRARGSADDSDDAPPAKVPGRAKSKGKAKAPAASNKPPKTRARGGGKTTNDALLKSLSGSDRLTLTVLKAIAAKQDRLERQQTRIEAALNRVLEAMGKDGLDVDVEQDEDEVDHDVEALLTYVDSLHIVVPGATTDD